MAHAGLDTAYATLDPSGVILGESNSEELEASMVSAPSARSFTQISRLPDRSELNTSFRFLEIEGNTSVDRSRVTRRMSPATLPWSSSIGRLQTLVLAATVENTRLPLDATEGLFSSAVPKVRRRGAPRVFPVRGGMTAFQRLVVSRRAEKKT